jgi:hypothetical protein
MVALTCSPAKPTARGGVMRQKKRLDTGDTGPAQAHLAIYDGTNLAGFIECVGGQFLAFDHNRRKLGLFASQREASRAIPPVFTKRNAA